MRKSMYFLVFSLLAMSSFAFADGDPTAIISGDQFLGMFLQSIGGMGGLKGMALAVAVVQVVMKFLQSDIAVSLLSKFLPAKDGALAGHVRISIVCVLSVATGLLALKLQGLGWTSALLHSTTLAALQIAANQIYKQFSEKAAA